MQLSTFCFFNRNYWNEDYLKSDLYVFKSYDKFE